MTSRFLCARRCEGHPLGPDRRQELQRRRTQSGHGLWAGGVSDGTRKTPISEIRKNQKSSRQRDRTLLCPSPCPSPPLPSLPNTHRNAPPHSPAHTPRVFLTVTVFNLSNMCKRPWRSREVPCPPEKKNWRHVVPRYCHVLMLTWSHAIYFPVAPLNQVVVRCNTRSIRPFWKHAKERDVDAESRRRKA